jgi:hypothetical protein
VLVLLLGLLLGLVLVLELVSEWENPSNHFSKAAFTADRPDATCTVCWEKTKMRHTHTHTHTHTQLRLTEEIW